MVGGREKGPRAGASFSQLWAASRFLRVIDLKSALQRLTPRRGELQSVKLGDCERAHLSGGGKRD